MCANSLQSCLTPCDPMDCSLPGSSVHGISQARILQRVVIPFSRGSSQPRVQTVNYKMNKFWGCNVQHEYTVYLKFAKVVDLNFFTTSAKKVTLLAVGC